MVGQSRLSDPLDAAGRSLAGRVCVVALSGGPDSAALGWLAVRYAAGARFVHVNHGLPGSASMEEAARAVAAALERDLTVIDVDVPGGASSEAQARTVRYRALLEALRPDEILVTGHSADDAAETVLINLGRGTGLAGLSGIPAERGPVVRPLLGVRRAELLALAQEESLPFGLDPANADSEFLRNRIRRDVLPHYAKALERDPVPAMQRSAVHAARALSAIESSAKSVPVTVDRGVARAPLARVAIEGLAVQAEVVRRLVQAIRPPYPPSTAEVDRVLAVAAGTTGTTELDGGFIATASRTNLLVGSARGGVAAPVAWEHSNVQFDEWTLRRSPISPPTVRRLASQVACVVPDTVGEMVVRPVAPGDSFPVPGGTKRAAAAIAEAGIPDRARRRHPVVVASGMVVWIPGVRATGLGWEEQPPSGYLLLDVVEEGPWK